MFKSAEIGLSTDRRIHFCIYNDTFLIHLCLIIDYTRNNMSKKLLTILILLVGAALFLIFHPPGKDRGENKITYSDPVSDESQDAGKTNKVTGKQVTQAPRVVRTEPKSSSEPLVATKKDETVGEHSPVVHPPETVKHQHFSPPIHEEDLIEGQSSASRDQPENDNASPPGDQTADIDASTETNPPLVLSFEMLKRGEFKSVPSLMADRKKQWGEKTENPSQNQPLNKEKPLAELPETNVDKTVRDLPQLIQARPSSRDPHDDENNAVNGEKTIAKPDTPAGRDDENIIRTREQASTPVVIDFEMLKRGESEEQAALMADRKKQWEEKTENSSHNQPLNREQYLARLPETKINEKVRDIPRLPRAHPPLRDPRDDENNAVNGEKTIAKPDTPAGRDDENIIRTREQASTPVVIDFEMLKRGESEKKVDLMAKRKEHWGHDDKSELPENEIVNLDQGSIQPRTYQKNTIERKLPELAEKPTPAQRITSAINQTSDQYEQLDRTDTDKTSNTGSSSPLVIDVEMLKRGESSKLAQLMRDRRKRWGLDTSVDVIATGDEKVKIDQFEISLEEIQKHLKILDGIILIEDLDEKGKTQPLRKTLQYYGVRVVRPHDNLWNIHFGVLKEYLNSRGLDVSPEADEPLHGGKSSGVGRVLKFAENMVMVYNMRTKMSPTRLDKLQPGTDIIIFNMTPIFTLLGGVNFSELDRIRFNGKMLYLEPMV